MVRDVGACEDALCLETCADIAGIPCSQLFVCLKFLTARISGKQKVWAWLSSADQCACSLLVNLQLSPFNNHATQAIDSNLAEGTSYLAVMIAWISACSCCARWCKGPTAYSIYKNLKNTLGSRCMGLAQLYKDALFCPVHSHQMQEPSTHNSYLEAEKQCMLKAW